MAYPAGPEQDQPTPPAPAKKKRTGLIVLSIVFVLLFGAAGTLGVLYFTAKSRSDSLTTQLQDLDRQQQDATKKVLDGNGEVGQALDNQRKAEDAQKKAEDDGARMVRCQEAARALREAAVSADRDKVGQAGNKLISIC